MLNVNTERKVNKSITTRSPAESPYPDGRSPTLFQLYAKKRVYNGRRFWRRLVEVDFFVSRLEKEVVVVVVAVRGEMAGRSAPEL